MKVYVHLCFDGFTNSYTVLNDNPDVMEAVILDPGKVDADTISLIETGGYSLAAVLITHNHKNHLKGLQTLKKIYAPTVYSADSETYGMNRSILNGDGTIRVAGLNVDFFSVPGHSPDSMVYKIEDMLFTGDTVLSGLTGSTSSSYSQKLLCRKIREKLFSLPGRTVVFPGHGAPSTIESERQFNIDVT
ncbi:MAG: MBL fold metallo-hydrolase [Treponema sp.]|nr:MBL fold metallo-hydrolase [Treponema sp.]